MYTALTWTGGSMRGAGRLAMQEVDRGAAPAWAGHRKLLNPTVSALLNDKVFGNALLLRVSKLDGPADGGVNAVLSDKGALQILSLTPTQIHAYVQGSDNVAWQMDCYNEFGPFRNLAPVLVESLATDDRAAWLSRLPLAPLDKQGNPDLPKALAMIKTIFKIHIPATRTRFNGYSEARQQLPESYDSAGAVTSSEYRREGPESTGEKVLRVTVPRDVAPLLRALRCTSPWCNPIRHRRPTTQNSRMSSCPFGHFWRGLGLGERNSAPRLIFNAARLCGSKPLEPELCPALIDRLLQKKGSVTLLGKGDVIQALSRQISHNGNSGGLAPIADVTFAPDASDSMEDEWGLNGENAEEVDEKAAAPKSPAETLRSRVEDLTFYLSFCRDGPRCRRCHSYYELNLAVALQRLNGGGRVSSSAVAPGKGQGRPPRRGFDVLAALSDMELRGRDDDRKDHSSKLAGDEARIETSAVNVAKSTAGGGVATAAPQSGPLPSAEGTTVDAAAADFSAMGSYGGSFNWADELEAAEASQEAAAPRSLASRHRPPWARSQVPAAAHLQRDPCPSTGGPQPVPPLAHGGKGTGMGWNSCAPICCHEVSCEPTRTAVERTLQRDLRPLPRLPDTLDLEPLEAIPDRLAVSASMAAKSRKGIYVPPHLRIPMDNEAGTSEQVAVPQVGESPAEELQDTTEVRVTPAMVVEPRSLSQMTLQGMATQGAEIFVTAVSQRRALQTAVTPGPNPGTSFSFDGVNIPPAYSLPRPITLVLPSATSPALMPETAEQQRVGNYQAQARPPAGFYQDQAQAAQQPAKVLPVPVPIPIPLPVVQHTSAQRMDVFDGPHLPSPTALPKPLETYNPAYAPGMPTPIKDERSSTEIDNMFSECMSLCGISLGESPQRLRDTTVLQSSQTNGHLFTNAVFGCTSANNTHPGVGCMEAAAPLPVNPYAPPHMPERTDFHVRPQPRSARVDTEHYAPAMPPPLFAAPLLAPSLVQPNGLQPTQWLQPQHPYTPPGFVPRPLEAGAPFYGMPAVGVPQMFFQSHQPPLIPHGGLSPVGAYGPSLGAFAGYSTGRAMTSALVHKRL
ncbi:hypothetical protein Vretimale_7893 [Volvox reticuliferus]|uniref:Uncharacterized protein n=1 Tax=Volvox reticuliferus TaxID=1737510 RepID=A0A8J4G9T8_9CHLO|nr:hypothetical protein Vretimale_7893 [Volvox reticuliferus]